MGNMSQEPRIPNYYEKLGRSHDCLMRCNECKGLIVYQDIAAKGGCPKCGNRRFVEITLLSETEMEAIAKGEIDFPDRAAFMAEFHGVE